MRCSEMPVLCMEYNRRARVPRYYGRDAVSASCKILEAILCYAQASVPAAKDRLWRSCHDDGSSFPQDQ